MKTLTNYYKYHLVKDQLANELQTEQPAKQIAEKLNISVGTFHKYKSLFQMEKGQQFATIEERAFLERMKASAPNPPPVVSGVSQKKSEPGQEPEPQPKSTSKPEVHAKSASPTQEIAPAAPEVRQEPTLAAKGRK